ncbi:CRISPR-associated protein Cas4 [Haloferax volcanii]|uniref:CRISPR-associated protein Cas4 n=1 Tax=Haloferax volcanii TaxID=2246 RepID=UPI00385367FA
MSQSSHNHPGSKLDSTSFIDRLSGDSFATWYEDRRFRQNIRDGQHYFNEPSKSRDPGRHTPSNLLNCHRKQFYKELNAPKETENPDGIFWFGTAFEEQIVLPFLERIVSEVGGYVQKYDWIDYSIEADGTELRFKGRTDPLIVDADSVPVVAIEVKTRNSVKSLDSPSRTHRAQIHAYMVGLGQKYNIRPPDGVILYGSRKTFDVRCFHVKYNETFWNEVVVKWATAQTRFRTNEILPPADPEQKWECGYCPYSERCGKGESSAVDSGVHGFVPEFTEYPRRSVEEYLRLFPNVALTPALASKYPDIASEHLVPGWCCERCGYTVKWDAITTAGEPLCPQCAEKNILEPLSRPRLSSTEVSNE